MPPTTRNRRPARARPRAPRRAAAPSPPPAAELIPATGLDLFEPEGGTPNPLHGATLGAATGPAALELFPPEVAADRGLAADDRSGDAPVMGPSAVNNLPLVSGGSELAPASLAPSVIASAWSAVTTTTSAWQHHALAVPTAGAAGVVLVLVAIALISRGAQDTLGSRATVVGMSELRPRAIPELPTPLLSSAPAPDVATTTASAVVPAVALPPAAPDRPPATAPPPAAADRPPAIAPPPAAPDRAGAEPGSPAPAVTATSSAPLVAMASPAAPSRPEIEASAAAVPEAPAPAAAPAPPPVQRGAAEPAATVATPIARSDVPAGEATAVRVPAGAAPESRPASLPAAPARDTASLARDTEAIQSVLRRYGEAFSRLDIGGVSQVWPGVDAEALGRAFRGLDEQVLSFDACNIDVSGTSAGASCRGTVRYVTKIGNRNARTERRVWQFSLRNAGERWVIERVNSR